MALIEVAWPRFRQIRLPLSRDQLFLLLAAFNQLFIALDIYLAHSINGTLKANEWLPIAFGAVAGIALLAAGAVALRHRVLATRLANLVFMLGIVVGLLGAWFHLNRTVLLGSGLVSREAVSTLIWAPPVIGPLFFILVSLLGITAAWVETPVDSGRLRLSGSRHVQMPYSKTRAYMLITAIFILATLISSVLDHARLGFANPWVWLPVAAALFAFATALFIGIVKEPNRGDVVTNALAMVLLIATGVAGFVLHADASLTSAGQIVVERFLRGSPALAPLLFCNVGVMGLLAMLTPQEA